MKNAANMQQTVHAFPLFATAQKPDARKSGKARRLLLFVSHNKKYTNRQEIKPDKFEAKKIYL